jgi:hypothetical protein
MTMALLSIKNPFGAKRNPKSYPEIIYLIRHTSSRGSTKGVLISNNQFFKTLENDEYIFPDGTYRIKYEWSPKFSQYLWEFKDIQGRSEIKFHAGSSKQHSRGCVLLGHNLINHFHNTLDNSKTYKIKVKTIK